MAISFSIIIFLAYAISNPAVNGLAVIPTLRRSSCKSSPMIYDYRRTRVHQTNDDDIKVTTDVNVLNAQSQLARMNALAAKLRAEASALEASQMQEFTTALSKAFEIYDVNKDGFISLAELKKGIEDNINYSINEDQAKKIMTLFDTSGDGKIQFEEFKGNDAFKLKLEKILAEEKKAALEALNESKAAALAAEKAEKKLQIISELINNQPPSSSDRIVSSIPYLLPLADVLPYSRAYIENNHLEQSPVFEFAAIIYSSYQSIPFSGLIAFFIFNAVANNLKLNRLVRFNIQQAILLDIFLIIPGLIGGIATALITNLGVPISKEVIEFASTITFLSVSFAILYSMLSSLFGIIPDKLPILSEQVTGRVPTTADVMKFFDEDGNLKQFPDKESDEKDKNKDKSE